MARAAVVASVLVSIVAPALAAGASHASYTAEEVAEAFDRHGYGLVEVDRRGWTAYAPLVGSPGTVLFPRPSEQAPFYVFVARSDRQAEDLVARRGRAGSGPGMFDLLHGNVVVSSDTSLTRGGPTTAQRLRVRAALRSLDSAR